MEVDFKNLNEVRARYIGIDIGEMANNQIFFNRLSSVVLPREIQTFSELGMPWIDRGILRTFKRPRIYTIMAANLENGGFLPEVDNFIGAHENLRLGRLGRWQAILYRSGLYENAYRSYTSSNTLLGENEEWINPDHQTICIDQDFLLVAQRAAEHIIFGTLIRPTAAYRLFLQDVIEAGLSMTRPNVSCISLRVSLKSMLHSLAPNTDFDIDKLFRLSAAEKETIRAAMNFQYTDGAVNDIFNVIRMIGGAPEKQRQILLQYVRSIVFHFVIGHELGHVSFAAQENKDSLSDILEYFANTTNLSALGDLEECYCDLVGVANCAYQTRAFGIPFCLSLVISYAAWLMANLKNNYEDRLDFLRARHQAFYLSWRHFSSEEEKDLIENYYNRMTSILPPLLLILCSKLYVISQLNTLLNPEDEDRTRTLNDSLSFSIYLRSL